MRILILGGDGMLGHQLLKSLASNHEFRVTLRHELPTYSSYGLFHNRNAYARIDVRTLEPLTEVLADFRPDDSFRCDRSLDSTRFRREYDYTPPTWEAMIEELAKEIR